MGKKTLLIDADMRNPTVHRLFSIPVKTDFRRFWQALPTTSPYQKQILKIFLFLRPAKFRQTRQSFYQVKERISFLAFVKQHYDCVFIDTPPVNLVTDPTAFATKSTGYIMIVKAGISDTQSTKKQLTLSPLSVPT